MNDSQRDSRGIGGIVGLGLLAAGAFVCLLAVFGSFYTIQQTQRGVLLRNGAFVAVVQPGLHFKWPFFEAIHTIDMQTHTHTWPERGAKFEAYSADSQPASLKVSVTLHVAPDRVLELYTRFGGDVNAAITRIITPHVNERIKTVFGQYNAARAISARGQLNSDTAASMTAAIAYDPVFVIESVQIEDISFSGDYIKSVEQRMQMEVEVQRYQQQLARERVQADILTTQAKAKADAVRLEAQANADARVLIGNAEATAIKARGDALAQNPGLVYLVQAERWDGRQPQTIMMPPGGSTPLLAISTPNIIPPATQVRPAAQQQQAPAR